MVIVVGKALLPREHPFATSLTAAIRKNFAALADKNTLLQGKMTFR
jgi:hypothetical protein